VIRFRVFLGTALALSAIIATFVNAQLTDEEKKKRDARIKAREEMRAVASPTPAETPEPTAKPKPAKRKSKKLPTPKPKPTATPTVRKSPRPDPDESPTPKSKARSGTKKPSEEDETPKPERTEKTESGESLEPTKKPGARKSPTPEPDESATPKSKAKSGTKKSSEKDKEATPKPKRMEKAESKESPEPTKKPGAKKSPTPEPDESPIPKSGAKRKTDAKKEATPKRIEKSELAKTPAPTEKLLKTAPEPTRTSAPEPSAHPRPVSTPSLPQAALPPDITVEKSGLEKEQGLEPPPPPPPRRGVWPWSRQPANYRYLTSATIDAIRRAPVQRARWKFIIVHNSGTRQGNARAFDYYHRKIRRMRNGLAYHFVIGNGTSSRNGQIEIGDRWRRQISGGHVHSDYMNHIGLGICLVGDFNRDQPTRAQLEACEELIRYLQERCGKSDGRSLIVRPHREVNPPRWATDCPGDAFPYGWFGRFR
jgi:N-acetylmuramoyl-L-alanine amidase-like protein